MKFNCSWDNTVLLITLITCVVLLAIVVYTLVIARKYKQKKRSITFLSVSVCLIVLLTLFIPLFYMPTSVYVNENTIVIHQLKGNTAFELKDIVEIRRATKNDTEKSIRTFGSGGLFGALGWFKSPNLGKYFMFVTNKSDCILLKNNERTVIFSCNNPDKLIEQINLPH
jgi:amino acid transporter